MTKLALVTACFVAFAMLPSASAHGAVAVREIDTRVLVDHDGALGPAECVHDAPQTCDARPNKGLDLVSLDVRETHWINGTDPVPIGVPAVVFRVTVQENLGAPDQVVEIHATAGGEERHFGFASNTTGNYTADGCVAFEGPLDLEGGDGAQKAFDCFVPYSHLGINGTGNNSITGIEVHSEVAGAAFDVMPGTWYANGQLVPFVPEPNPDDPTAVEEPTQTGTYNITGPAKLLNASVVPRAVDLRAGPPTAQVTVRSTLTNMSQVAMVNITTPPGILASLDKATAILDGGGQANVTLSVASASRDGVVAIVVTSDLGAYELILITVRAPAAAPVCPTETVTGSASSHTQSTSPGTTTCPTTSTTTTEAAGAPEMVFVASLLALFAAIRRREA